jgi:hypothetical protein
MYDGSGYVILSTGKAALALCGEFGVRYAARCANGKGFVAFDAPDGETVFELAQRGQLLMAAIPPWPVPRYPKRGVATGEETFTLLRPTISAEALMDEVAPLTLASVIVTEDGLPFVLIETGRYVPAFDHGEIVWQGVAVEHRDVRELAEV